MRNSSKTKNSNLAVKTAKHENSEKSNLSGHYSREWNECFHVNHSFLNRVQQTVSGNAPSHILQTPLAGQCLGAL